MHYKEKSYSVETDRPGDEVDKDHRKVIKELIDNQGWSYRLARGGGYPACIRLIPRRDPSGCPRQGTRKGARSRTG